MEDAAISILAWAQTGEAYTWFADSQLDSPSGLEPDD